MSDIVQHFTPSLSQLLGLLGLVLVSFVMVVFGALIGGPRRLAEADLVIGWSVLSSAFVIVGVPTPLPLDILGYTLVGLAVPAGVVTWFRYKRLVESDALRIFALSLPLIVLVSAMAASQWDEFTQWLPNARYLWDNDVFPRAGYVAPDSEAPGNPYALSTVIYMTSLIARSFVENAGAMFNLVLTLCFALVVARLIRSAISAPKPDRYVKLGLWAPMTGAHGWGYCAIGGLAVTVLNPTFVPNIAFTAYGDSATSMAFGVAMVLAWLLLEALGEEDRPRARALAIQLGLALAVAVNVKTGNVSLLVLLVAGMLLVAVRDPALQTADVVRLAHWIVVPPLLVYGLWQLHLMAHVPTGGVGPRDISHWHPSLIPDIIAQMALVASRKIGFFGIMLVALWFGSVALIRRPRDAFDRLAIMTGVAFVAFQAYLLFAYVAAVEESDARRAAAYWRYCTQLGGVTVAFAAYGLALLWRRHLTLRLRRDLNWVPVLLILAAPVVMSHKIRFDDRPRNHYIRGVGAELAGILPKEARLAILDPSDDGFHETMMRYEMYKSAEIVLRISADDDITPDALAAMLTAKRASHAWVHVATPVLEVALEQPLAKGASYLLSRANGSWRIDRTWPYPGDDVPPAAPD